MKITQLVVDYQITRSRDFQSVRMGASATVEIAEGDDKKAAIEKTTRWLANCLNPQADEALCAAIEERRMVEGI
jgi:hypothetical protein